MKLKYHDGSHSYYLDGKRCTSVTSVAKVLEDGYRLTNYQKRMVAIGLASSPDLVERVAAHFDERQTLDSICEEAQQRAGAHKAAGKGTAAHRITERHDAGSDLIETEFSRRVRHAWQTVLDRHQLEVVLSERIVVWPDQLVAGRFDRICRRPDGSLVVVDLKTGDRAIQYPHSIAIQLALYACAPYIAGEIPPSGGTTESFIDMCMPDTTGTIDDKVAIVVHLPDGGEAQAYEFDIAAGYEAAQLCFQALAWRKRKELCRPLDTEENGHGRTDLEQGQPNMGAGLHDEPRRDAVDHERAPSRHAQPDGAVPAVDLAAAIRALPADVSDYIRRYWPTGTPTPKAIIEGRGTWTAAEQQHAEILMQAAKDACLYSTPEEQAAKQAETDQRWEERFGPKPVAGAGVHDSAASDSLEQGHVEGTSTRPLPDEAGPADPDAVQALVAQLRALTPEQNEHVSRWVRQANDAGVPYGAIQRNPTRRRYAIARASRALAVHMDGDDELVRMALALVLGAHNVPHPDFLPVGALLGSLTPEEADRLTRIAEDYKPEQVTFDESGVGRLLVV